MFIVDTVAKFVPGVVSEILKSISLYSRYGDFSIGLFSIAPIVFYISISVVFLFLSVRSIEKRRWA